MVKQYQTYRFQWYLTLVCANHSSSNLGLVGTIITVGDVNDIFAMAKQRELLSRLKAAKEADKIAYFSNDKLVIKDNSKFSFCYWTSVKISLSRKYLNWISFLSTTRIGIPMSSLISFMMKWSLSARDLCLIRNFPRRRSSCLLGKPCVNTDVLA